MLALSWTNVVVPRPLRFVLHNISFPLCNKKSLQGEEKRKEQTIHVRLTGTHFYFFFHLADSPVLRIAVIEKEKGDGPPQQGGVCVFEQRALRFALCWNKWQATGVNMLGKSDLGQRPCLHLSR